MLQKCQCRYNFYSVRAFGFFFLLGEPVIKEMSSNAESLSEFKPRSTGTKWCSIPKRYVQAMLGFLALFIVFWMRNSFGAAVFHILESRNSYVDEMKIPWSYRELSISDSTFICGFTVAQIPGALLTFKFSSHRILLISMVLTTILHTLAPFLLSCGSAWIITLRLLQGIAEGPIYPACVGIWKSWAPPSERTRLLCIVLCGSFFGSVAGLPLNTELVNHFGPKGCFFISTTAGLLWCLMWLMHIYENPSSHPYISHHEQSFLEESIDVDNNLEITVKSIPWKAMFTSLPVWVVLLASIWYFSSEYFLVNSPSIYYSIESGFENDYILLWDILLPNIIMGAVVFASGFCADYLIKVNLSRSLVRKLFCCGAFTLHGVTLLVERFCKNIESTVICINLAHGFLGLSLAGFWLNCLDFSPYYGTIVMALLQTFGNLCDAILSIYVHPGLYYPLTGAIHRLDAFIAVSFIVSLAYAIFGSGNVQSWGKPETMHRRPTQDELQRSTYYSYPEAEDFVEMVGDSQLLLDVHPEHEKERY